MIRTVERRDVPAIVRLHLAGFGRPDESAYPPPDLGYEEFLFGDPMTADGPHSLVLESGAGEIVGFVGVMPRRIIWRDTQLQAAVPTKFLVAPVRGASVLAGKLLRYLLTRPYDLLLCDGATGSMRRIWKAAGGTVLSLRSLDWIRVFRPGEHLRSRLQVRGGPAGATAVIAKPFAYVADRFLERVGWNALPASDAVVTEPSLDAARLAAIFGAAGSRFSIRSVFAVDELEWRLRILRRLGGEGATLEGLVMTDQERNALGAALYFLRPGGSAQVLKSAAIRSRNEEAVLHGLLRHVLERGAATVEGQLIPMGLEYLARDRCTLSIKDRWFLVHTTNPDLLNDLHADDLFFDRLDGEWW